MNQQQLKNIINHHYRELSIHLKKITENFGVEEIHQFRVEYKKLRALLRLVSNQKKVSGNLKISIKLKKYYHIAGEIRDLQLQKQRIGIASKPANKKPQAYLDLVQVQIEKLKSALDDNLLDSAVKGCKPKTVSTIPKHFQTKSFKKFAMQKWEKVYEIISYPHLSDDNIHAIRINLKDLFYNLKVFAGKENSQLYEAVLKGKEETTLDKFLNELGDYHDICIAILLLKSNHVTTLNSNNRELLAQIRIQWKKDKLHFRQLLVKQLRTEIAPLSIKQKE